MDRPYIVAIAALALVGSAVAAPERCAGRASPTASSQPAPAAAPADSSELRRGTKELPEVVELSPASLVKVEAMDATKRRVDYRATVGLGRKAQQTASEQTDRMERSVVEAARAATAMEGVGRATTQNAALMQSLVQKQMRAYLSVEMGAANYQDARLRFEALPRLMNNGLTPARNVSFKVLADLLDGSGHGDLVFPDVGELIANDVSVAPRASFTLSGAVDHRVPDAEVEAIMQGNTRRLFAWGKVTYDDVYGGSWETNFCCNYVFFRNAKGEVVVSGYYYRRHNNST